MKLENKRLQYFYPLIHLIEAANTAIKVMEDLTEEGKLTNVDTVKIRMKLENAIEAVEESHGLRTKIYPIQS